jgi:hypothetical protein
MKHFDSIKWTDIPRDQFDAEYFSKLLMFFYENRGRCFSLVSTNEQKTYNGNPIKCIAENYEKVVQYIKFYVEIRRLNEFPDVTFSDNYELIYIK